MEFHSTDYENVLTELRTTANGLDSEEIRKRQEEYGLNVISGRHKRTVLDILIDQFKNFLILLLIAAAGVSFLIGHTLDAIGISAAICLSVIFGFILEYKADESMRALQAMQAPKAIAIRAGKTVVVDAIDLVPGDIIHLEEGEKIPADCRVMDESGLQVNEAPLTGESISVMKNQKPVPENAPISERTSMLYAGTFVVQGNGTAVVVFTGDKTELGKIAAKLSEIESEETVLKKSLDDLGKKVSIASIAAILVLFAIGIVQEKSITDLFVLGISLAVAAVPEGLLTVLTIILALGVKRMAQEKALVRKLNAVETLGNASVIVVDKTGTITQGKMALTYIYEAGKTCAASEIPEKSKILEYSSYCNSAKITDKGIVGDEMDRAVLHSAEMRGLNIGKITAVKKLAFYPLDSVRKRMSAVVEIKGEKIAMVKGAPEIILDLSESIEYDGNAKKMTKEYRADVHKKINEMASEGARLLAVAYKKTSSVKENEVEKGLVFLGLMAFSDPVRAESYETLKAAAKAGIKVIMLTGDNMKTAITIGREVGLLDGEGKAVEWRTIAKMTDDEIKNELNELRIIARSTPLSKLKIVELLIEKGEIVVVTGDGVNDALALKKAQVGVVMGSGTDVSKEAGNLVLLDDNIATLVAAIAYGRTIFNNIINFIRFQFTTNLAMLALFFISFFANLPYLLTPVQILFINIVMDGPPALALGFERATKDVLLEKPRKNKNILSPNLAKSITITSAFMVLVTLAVYFYYANHAPELALTATFSVFVMMQLFNALNCRFSKEHFFHNPMANIYVFAAVILLFGLMVAINNVSDLEMVFSTTQMPLSGWILVTLAASTVLVFEEIKKAAFGSLTNY
jgi:Ca2+-transporting ATPase